VTEGSEVLGAAGIFPRSNSIQLDEKIAIARDEGFHPLAIKLSIGSHETSAAQKWLQLGLVMIAAVLVAFLFPFDRFFKPRAQELGMMTIGDPVSGNMSESGQPWLKALLKMDQLYFREGKLTEAIQVAERNLAQVPQKDWESWHRVHYRYWELLADAGKFQSLKAATRSYLENLPEDPFANYYAAHAFLATVEPMRSFTSGMRQDFRLEAETLVQQIERTGKALMARQKAEKKPGTKGLITESIPEAASSTGAVARIDLASGRLSGRPTPGCGLPGQGAEYSGTGGACQSQRSQSP
jgi:tetratricopeptide (TPR) repeat protein